MDCAGADVMSDEQLVMIKDIALYLGISYCSAQSLIFKASSGFPEYVHKKFNRRYYRFSEVKAWQASRNRKGIDNQMAQAFIQGKELC